MDEPPKKKLTAKWVPAYEDAGFDPAKVDEAMRKYANLVFVDAVIEPMRPPPVDEFLAERARAEAERKRRQDAVRRLWRHALDGVRVRHPDPRVDVRLGTAVYSGEMVVEFRMYNMRDTSDPDRLMGAGFRHYGAVGWNWPGLGPARTYTAALWSLYMVHEALELTTLRERAWDVPPEETGVWERACQCGLCVKAGAPAARYFAEGQRRMEDAIVSAHDSMGAPQRSIASSATRDLARTMDYVLGLGQGRLMLDEWAERARMDVENEIEPWEPGT